MAQTLFGSITIIVSCIAGAMLTLFLLQRYWTPSTRRAHNDVIGLSVSVIGTTYAVLIAFMLSGVWNDLQAARVNTEQEANSLVNVFRLADQLPPDSRAEGQKLTRDESSVMITEEWQAMKEEKSSPTAHVHDHEAVAYDYQRSASQRDGTTRDASLSLGTDEYDGAPPPSPAGEPQALAGDPLGGPDRRWDRNRGSTCLLGVEDFKLSLVQVFEISFLISLTPVAIAAIDRPFQGDVHVSPDAFSLRARHHRSLLGRMTTSVQVSLLKVCVGSGVHFRSRVASSVNSEPTVRVISLVHGLYPCFSQRNVCFPGGSLSLAGV
jgi:hypothetical protein